jgi:hypothetical protein
MVHLVSQAHLVRRQYQPSNSTENPESTVMIFILRKIIHYSIFTKYLSFLKNPARPLFYGWRKKKVRTSKLAPFEIYQSAL